MEVIPFKRKHRKRLVIQLPEPDREYVKERESEQSRFSKDQPDLSKTFKRLSQTEIKSRKAHQPHCGYYVPSTITIPNKAGMRCVCYENIMNLLDEQTSSPLIDRYSKDRASKGRIHSMSHLWTGTSILRFRDKKDLQFPLGTLLVRWQLKRNIPLYDIKTLRAIFERFGPVTDVRIRSPNIGLVIFPYVEQACRVMQSRYLGDSMNKLSCSWWHAAMENKHILTCVNIKGVYEKSELFLV